MTISTLKNDQHSKYRPDIDGLRAIAVLLVVGFHAFPEWVKGGFIGVDIFFVISGFLISSIIITNLRNDKFSISDYYLRRVRRIFPALLAVLFFCLVLGWFVLLPPEYAYLGEHIAAGAGFVSNWVLWRESGYFDVSAELKPLLHLWSLGIEEQFYIVWPILLWLAVVNRLNMTVVLLAIAAASFIFNIVQIGLEPISTFYLPWTRFWELICGALLANWMLHQQQQITSSNSIIIKNICSVIGLGLIAAGSVLITKEAMFPGWLALIPVVAAVLIIYSSTHTYINSLLLSNRVLVWIGLISFPLYLWHWPLLAFARILENETPGRYTRIAAVLLAIVLAWLTYLVIERPIRFGKARQYKTILLCTLMTLVGGAGYLVYANDGLKNRYPDSYQLYVEKIDFKWPSYVRFDQCHIQSHNLSEHSEICRETKHPLIAIWGDSHASSLYPGFKKLQESQDIGVEQLTTAGCPPLMNLQDLRFKKNCNEINQSVLKTITLDQPEILILHAAWRHEQYPLTDQELSRKLKSTIQTIQSKLPKVKIVLLGPTPRWKGDPQSESFRYLRALVSKKDTVPQIQMAEKLNDIEKVLKTVATDTRVEYVSVTDALCNAEGCLARTSDRPEDFTSIDYGHLSKSGSEYLIEQLASKLLTN
jgi:peptidoglycan/LPS O-acetylase OafA/YrhL